MSLSTLTSNIVIASGLAVDVFGVDKYAPPRVPPVVGVAFGVARAL